MQTATELLDALRQRRTSAVDLLEQTFTRIDRLNPALNAIVVQDRAHARSAAVIADAAIQRGERGPLLGLPMTVKECFDIAGLPTTWGIAGTGQPPAARDSVVVERLRAAGAIVFGKTNVPPNLADWQSSNPVYGRTNNPWDPGRTPGGSSGGSAAALAAGLVALEMGSDIGGSLRVPAHCCGVFAHKPSWGIVPMRGCAPPGTPLLSVSNPVDLAVAGPMARSAADLALALEVVAGPDQDQAAGYRLQLPMPRHKALKDFRVLVLHDHPMLPTGTEVADAISRWTDRLAGTGCQLSDNSDALPDLARMAQTYSWLLLAFFGANQPLPAYQTMQQAADRLPAGSLTDQARELRALTSSHRDWLNADRQRTGIRHAWRQFFTRWDLVVCPVMPLTALPHDDTPAEQRSIQIDQQSLPYNRLSLWASLATLAGLPATSIPIGSGSSGLPVGVQAIGAQFEDRTTLAFAQAVEQALGGFAKPPGIG